MNAEGLFALIREGEGPKTEFKSQYTKEVAKDICAFLNSDGGQILLGVADDGTVVGIKGNPEQQVSDILAGIRPAPGKLRFGLVNIDEKKILAIEVDRSDKLHSIGNVVYIRMGRNNRPLSTDEIIERAAESAMVFFDCLPSKAPKEAIDSRLFQEFLERRQKTRGTMQVANTGTQLRLNKVLVTANKTARVSNGGLLFFSHDPQEMFPQAAVRLVWFEDAGMKTVKMDREFKGPLWRIVDEVEGFFGTNLRNIGEAYAGWKRGGWKEYPMLALREAITNALIHRNYFDAAQIQISMFPDQIEIRNPGAFPPGVTVDAPEHKPRNPLICQYMYDMGYIEKYGSGILRMIESCKEHPLVNIHFELRPYQTRVIFRKEKAPGLDEIDLKILGSVDSLNGSKSTDIAMGLPVSQRTVVSKLNNLVILGFLSREGLGRATLYRLVRKIK